MQRGCIWSTHYCLTVAERHRRLGDLAALRDTERVAAEHNAPNRGERVELPLARLEEVDPPRAELLLVEGERRHRRLLGVEDSVGVAAGAAVGTAHQVDVLALERRRLPEEVEHLVDGGREGQAAQTKYAAVARVVAHRRPVAVARRLLLCGR